MSGRLRFFSILILAFALILVGKLYKVQILDSKYYKDRADHQYLGSTNFFDRGSIFFTDKDGNKIPGAAVKDGFLLAIDPGVLKEATDTEKIYNEISKYVSIDHDTWQAKLNKPSRYEELAKQLSTDVGQKIQNLNIKGVNVYKQDWRFYPGGSMAAHVLGLLGYGGADGNELAGRYGLERYYEDLLVRRDPAFNNFFAEVFSDVSKTIANDEKLEGDVDTTIEPTVQSQLEKELKGVEDKYSSDYTGGIIINPQNGEILAMALSPTFDPNSPQSAPNSDVFQDKLVEDRYEMGSIVKALTMAAGLDAGVVKRFDTYNDPGCLTMDKKTFCNYDGRSHGTAVTMQDVLNHSLNTGAAYVEQKLGNDLFRQYMYAYGLGSTTGIDLPNEGNSLVSNLTSPRDLEYAEASFGQGIALTPVQVVRALSTLANGGYLITPHVTKTIEYRVGTWEDVNPPKLGPIFKPETSHNISQMLTEVVDVALKNGTVRLPNYSIAAKTGTAQIASPTGGYYSDHYVHSFFGYFPSYNPQYLIFLYTYYPKNVEYASETLTDSFMNLTKFLINYYNVPPDRQEVPKY